jgi:ribosomal-protein-alanine N-acetyltransferase
VARLKIQGPSGSGWMASISRRSDWFIAGDPHHPLLGLWATVYKANGAFIGRCGLIPWTIDGEDEVEVAYLLEPRYWRQGMGTEAARGIVQYAFNTLNLKRIIALIDPANEASMRTAGRAGMRFERLITIDDGRSCLLYAIGEPLRA